MQTTETPSEREHWLLLRGLGREAAHWDDFPGYLQASLGGATLSLLDLPGTGRYWRDSSPATISGILQSVRQNAIQALPRPDRCCFVVGMSLGGMVALEWLRRYPTELRGVVLINSSVGGVCKPWQRLQIESVPALLRIVLCKDVIERERRILRLTSNREPSRALLEQRAEAYRSRPLRHRNFLRQLVAASRFRWRCPRAEVPMLLLSGAGDRLVNPNCSKQLQLASGAELRTHPTANHDLPLDEPMWTAAQIANWRAQRVGSDAFGGGVRSQPWV